MQKCCSFFCDLFEITVNKRERAQCCTTIVVKKTSKMKKFTLLIQSKCEKNDRKRKYKQRTAWTDTADQMLLEVCVDKIPQRERDRVT